MEKYISACLDSVFNQDIPEEEYEVICVNDGSPDGSRDIVCSYLPHHPNLRLIDHPCNMKLGAARNTGRKAARGNYIWHVDSDDMIAPNCLKHILEVCMERNLDVLEFCYTNLFDDGLCDSMDNHQVHRDELVYNGPLYLEKFHSHKIGGICGIWRKVYKKSFLDISNIYSPPINMGEDEPFAVEVFGLAERVSYLHGDYYIYRRVRESLTGENHKAWNAQKWFEACFVSTKYLDRSYRKVNKRFNGRVCQAIEDMLKYNLRMWQYKHISEAQRQEFWRLCRNNMLHSFFIFRYLNFKNSYLYIYNCFIGK